MLGNLLTYLLTYLLLTQRDAALLTMLGNLFFSLFGVLMAALAYAGSLGGIGWREQQYWLVVIPSVPLLCCCWLRESPRFLLGAGRHLAAETTIRQAMPKHDGAWCLRDDPSTDRPWQSTAQGPAAHHTRADVFAADAPPCVEQEASHIEHEPPPEPGQQAAPPPSVWAELCRPCHAFNLAVISASWFTCNLLFYGLNFAAGGGACTAASGCSIYVQGAIASAADFPGCALGLGLVAGSEPPGPAREPL